MRSSTSRSVCRGILAGLLGVFSLAPSVMAAHAAAATAVLLPGTPALAIGPIDFKATGTVVEEFVVSGTAASYKEVSPPDAEGRWAVQPDATAPYVTRIVVVRPPGAKFNGTVVVEWLIVSGGQDVGAV